MLKNSCELSLIVSKDSTNRDGSARTAIRKISDSLTVVRTFLPGRKNSDGTYGDSDGWEVHITSKTVIETTVEPGAHIDVEGFLTPKSYTVKNADGTESKRTYTALIAKKISKTEYEENTGSNAGSGSITIGPNTGAAPVASASAPVVPAPAPAPQPQPVPDYSDELPFA